MLVRDGRIIVENLDEMLEGQVAVLSSGYLSGEESIALLDALEKSRLYRRDQRSYILYPDRKLPSFLEKNSIPESRVTASEILLREAKTGKGRILDKDVEGRYHFNPDLRNAKIIAERLDTIGMKEGQAFSEEETEEFLKLYEEVFHHRRFTGRSVSYTHLRAHET